MASRFRYFLDWAGQNPTFLVNRPQFGYEGGIAAVRWLAGLWGAGHAKGGTNKDTLTPQARAFP